MSYSFGSQLNIQISEQLAIPSCKVDSSWWILNSRGFC